MENAMWAIGAVLGVLVLLEWHHNRILAAILERLVFGQGRIVDLLEKQDKSLEQQNYVLGSIASSVTPEPRPYVAPTVRFCDLCRKEYPQSNYWWTAYQSGPPALKLCAYPRQKEKPEDKWLHGEECIVAELRGYMTNVRRRLDPIEHKQEREYTENDSDFGTKTTRVLVVSSCNHCGKEYTESSFWWAVSRHGMEIEISEGFQDGSSRARASYFCGEECVVAAVRVFIGTQQRALPEEAWETYELASFKSVRHSTPREETPGCRETQRGGGLRFVLPGEPDYEYSVPQGDSTKAHFVLSNAGFEQTMKDDKFWAYVRTRPPGEWIKGWPVPTSEQVENAFVTFQRMGYLVRRSANQVIELVDSVPDGYRVPPKSESPRHSVAYRLGALLRKIAGRP